MTDVHASRQYQYSAPQAPIMSEYVTLAVGTTSPNTYFSPLVNLGQQQQQHDLSPQYHHSLPNYNQPWPHTMSRFLPSPPVKQEPLEPVLDNLYQSQHGYAIGTNDRFTSNRPFKPTSYHGRLHLQAPSHQMDATQQQPAFTNQFGHVSNMSRTEQSYYEWQHQQQNAYQSSRSSMSSTIVDQNSSGINSVATMAPLDMKPSSPASSRSGGNDSEGLADVSITLHPWATQSQNTTLYAGTTYLSSMGTFGTVQSTGRRYPSPPLASILQSSDDDPILSIEPPTAALSLREIQCKPGTNWSDPLQDLSGSEDDVSDSEDDAEHDSDDDEDAPHERYEHDDYECDHQQPPDNHDADHDSDESDSDDDDDEEHAYSPIQPANRISSLLDMPAATSNLRNAKANGVPDVTKVKPLKPKLQVFSPAVNQRAAAKVASKRITALSQPTALEVQVKPQPEPKQKPKVLVSGKSTPPKKRISGPRAARKHYGKKRALAVTSAAVSRVPAPIPNHNIHKRSRGRAVTTDPNEVDSNIVHVCPVPACGACFKRREHVKRHIRGLHTEDKPYQCKFPNCSSTFTRGDNLKGHYIKVHKTTIQKVYNRLALSLED